MIAFLVALWFLCGVLGLALGLSLAKKEKNPIEPIDAFYVLAGPILLLTSIFTIIFY